jgi:hypothetical protein
VLRSRVLGIAGLCLAGVALSVQADDVVEIQNDPSSQPASEVQPAQAAIRKPTVAEPQPPADLSAQTEPQGPSGSSNPGAGHPQMVGDLYGGTFVRRRLTFPTNVTLQVTTTRFDVGTQSVTTTSQNVTVPSTITREVNVPLISPGPFKIGENESPRPMDRVFTTYNYFNNVAVLPAGPDSIPPVVGQVNAGEFNRTTVTPGGSYLKPVQSIAVEQTCVLGFTSPAALQGLDVHREVIGFEKTVCCDDFSVEVRLPLVQQAGDPFFDTCRLGDVSVLGKYALINDEESGNVLSGGLVVTAPTGEDVLAVDGRILHSTLLQPFAGYFVNFDALYVQGFSAAIIPTDSRDSTLLTQDVAVGYRGYESALDSSVISYIIPTLEGHLTTPLKNRGSRDSPAGFPDIFVTTAAVHIGLGDQGSLTVGVGTPLTGPQPFDYEGIVQFNFRF